MWSHVFRSAPNDQMVILCIGQRGTRWLLPFTFYPRAPLSLHHVPLPLRTARPPHSLPQSPHPLSGRRADARVFHTAQIRSRIGGGGCWTSGRSAGCGSARTAFGCCTESPTSRRGSRHLASRRDELSCRAPEKHRRRRQGIGRKTHKAQHPQNDTLQENSKAHCLGAACRWCTVDTAHSKTLHPQAHAS